MAIAADRNDVRMFDDEELVRDLAGFAASDEQLLKFERLSPAQASEIVKLIAALERVVRH